MMFFYLNLSSVVFFFASLLFIYLALSGSRTVEGALL